MRLRLSGLVLALLPIAYWSWSLRDPCGLQGEAWRECRAERGAPVALAKRYSGDTTPPWHSLHGHADHCPDQAVELWPLACTRTRRGLPVAPGSLGHHRPVVSGRAEWQLFTTTPKTHDLKS